ncbi:MAG TPA: Asp23/Gls24 family envelope stress response protein [Chloroflexia bacterium]|nr:Asp23/Gls24 family envelope stress response protein [Chloroflexia bacterium]
MMTADGQQTETKKLGTVRIAPGVLATIVHAATLGVDGVIRMGDNIPSPGLSRIFSRDENAGVKIEVRDSKVYADLYIIVDKNANIAEVGKQVQGDVSKAIRHMVGMPVEQINVYIQNVE